MIVAELIKELEKMPQDCDVRICSTNAVYNEGYEDGYYQAVNDVLKTIVSGYIDARNELLRNKICAVDTSILEDSNKIVKISLDKCAFKVF